MRAFISPDFQARLGAAIRIANPAGGCEARPMSDQVIAIGDPSPRLDFARRMGATHTFDLGIDPG